MVKTAHYFAAGKTKYVIISRDKTPTGERVPVSGKAEARKIAAQNNAECWNF